MGKYRQTEEPESNEGVSQDDAAAFGSPLTAAKTKTIDGRTYRGEPFGALKGLELWPSVVGLFGEAGGLAGDALFGGYGEMVDMVQAGRALDVFAAKLVEVGGPSFVVEMLEQVYCLPEGGGEPQQMTRARIDNLRGRTMHLFKLVLFAVEVNYGDFFGAGRGDAAELKTSLYALLSGALTRATERLAESGSGSD